MKNPPNLTEAKKRELIATIEEINRRANGRPCMIIIRFVDGIPQIYEAGQPIRINGDDKPVYDRV